MIRASLAAVALLFVLLAGLLTYVGHDTGRNLDATVTDLFNRQQLILARNIAQGIVNHVQYLETSLAELAAAHARDLSAAGAQAGSLADMFGRYREWAVLAVGHAHGERVALYDIEHGSGAFDAGPGFLPAEVREWPADPAHRGTVYVGQDFTPGSGPYAGRRILILAAESLEPAAPGLVFLVADPIAVAMRYARPVRSGRTGYAWVINNEGVFLSHFEDSFIDQSSFEVRSRRNPEITYDRVNELVQTRLLKGEEGADWYVSGWHRGVIAEMKKLFAYSPVFYAGRDRPERLWSVGLAAPTTEVYGILEPFVMRQWLAAGSSLLIAFSGLAAVLFLSLRWARILRREVERVTADLSRSEAAVRAERDKVREGMRRLVETQEKLLRSERFAAIGQAASHLAHEIKNPLLLMGGFASQVRRKLPGDSPHIEKLGIIEEEAKRLEHMLVQVQNFTRPTRPCKEMADLNTAVEEVLRLMEQDMEDKGVACALDLDRSLPLVPHDPRQIRQVLLNLVKNAAEAMPDGGTLRLRTWVENGQARVSVADTGAGMSAQVLANVFSPFYTTKSQGTGLGLAVCFRILEDHGGEIGVQSQEGRGSTFTLALPLAEPPAKAEAGPSAAPAG